MQDLRDAYRALKATPVVTVVAILSLALGIGANTAVSLWAAHLVSALLYGLQPRDPLTKCRLKGQANAGPPRSHRRSTRRRHRGARRTTHGAISALAWRGAATTAAVRIRRCAACADRQTLRPGTSVVGMASWVGVSISSIVVAGIRSSVDPGARCSAGRVLYVRRRQGAGPAPS